MEDLGTEDSQAVHNELNVNEPLASPPFIGFLPGAYLLYPLSSLIADPSLDGSLNGTISQRSDYLLASLLTSLEPWCYGATLLSM